MILLLWQEKRLIKSYKYIRNDYSLATVLRLFLKRKLWYYYHGSNEQRVIEKMWLLFFMFKRGWNEAYNERKRDACNLWLRKSKTDASEIGISLYLFTDVLSKAAVNSLRNKISSISCDERYIKIYHNVKEALDYLSNGGYVAWLDYWFTSYYFLKVN